MWCWELNLGLVEEQSRLFNTQLYLQILPFVAAAATAIY